MRNDKRKIATVDSKCIVCGLPLGGHFFEGTSVGDGEWQVQIGGRDWLVVEHISGCYIWFCPRCVKIRKSINREV